MVDEGTVDEDIRRAFPADGSAGDSQAKLTCMRELHQHYMEFFTPPAQTLTLGDWVATPRITAIEHRWNAYEETRVRATNPELPTNAEEFRDWFAAVADVNEYHDICDYLRDEASLLDIALMVLAEGKVESYFDDLMALAQVGVSGETKMTIARNYWDEMGNGKHVNMHTVMLDNTTQWMAENAIPAGFDLDILEIGEAYANACGLLMYLLRRRYLLRGLGGLGLLEQTASARFAATVEGLKRLDVAQPVYRYQDTHVGVDQDHSREWVDGVFLTTIKENSDTIPELAMGVLIRGNVAAEFFTKVRQDLFGRG